MLRALTSNRAVCLLTLITAIGCGDDEVDRSNHQNLHPDAGSDAGGATDQADTDQTDTGGGTVIPPDDTVEATGTDTEPADTETGEGSSAASTEGDGWDAGADGGLSDAGDAGDAGPDADGIGWGGGDTTTEGSDTTGGSWGGGGTSTEPTDTETETSTEPTDTETETSTEPTDTETETSDTTGGETTEPTDGASTDAGWTEVDAGTGPVDAGTGEIDAGGPPVDADSGTGETDAGGEAPLPACTDEFVNGVIQARVDALLSTLQGSVACMPSREGDAPFSMTYVACGQADCANGAVGCDVALNQATADYDTANQVIEGGYDAAVTGNLSWVNQFNPGASCSAQMNMAGVQFTAGVAVDGSGEVPEVILTLLSLDPGELSLACAEQEFQAIGVLLDELEAPVSSGIETAVLTALETAVAGPVTGCE